MSQQPASRPEKEFRAGRASASIWRNESVQDGRTVVDFNIRIQKRFFDRQSGEWRETDYFFPNELSDLELVAAEARRYVRLRENDQQDDAAAA